MSITYNFMEDLKMTEFEYIDIFGDNLIDIMREQDITQRELAKKAKLPQSTISRLLNKKLMPSVKVAINLAYALGLSMDELIDLGDTIE